MKHFSMENWIDFVRQTQDEFQTVLMQRHLDERCARCLEIVEIWRRVVNFASQENRCTPPESAVRLVQASFSFHKMLQFPAEGLQLAKMVFDSAQQPSAAGVRGSSTPARQLLYRSGNVCIDLQIQPRLGSGSVVLIGQVLDIATPAYGMGDVSVTLLCGGDLISRKKTNDLGEFDFRFEMLQQVQLVIGIDTNRKVVVPVPRAELELGSPMA
jgi:hypothetical protein